MSDVIRKGQRRGGPKGLISRKDRTILIKHEDARDVDRRQAHKGVVREMDVTRKLCNICLEHFSAIDSLKRHYKYYKAIHMEIVTSSDRWDLGEPVLA